MILRQDRLSLAISASPSEESLYFPPLRYRYSPAVRKFTRPFCASVLRDTLSVIATPHAVVSSPATRTSRIDRPLSPIIRMLLAPCLSVFRSVFLMVRSICCVVYVLTCLAFATNPSGAFRSVLRERLGQFAACTGFVGLFRRGVLGPVQRFHGASL